MFNKIMLTREKKRGKCRVPTKVWRLFCVCKQVRTSSVCPLSIPRSLATSTAGRHKSEATMTPETVYPSLYLPILTKPKDVSGSAYFCMFPCNIIPPSGRKCKNCLVVVAIPQRSLYFRPRSTICLACVLSTDQHSVVNGDNSKQQQLYGLRRPRPQRKEKRIGMY